MADSLGDEIIEIEEGFVDATSLNGELLTLRTASVGGISIRNESTGEEYEANAPPDFSARSIGSFENSVVIGGHELELIREKSVVSNGSYSDLLRLAGPESDTLSLEPAPMAITEGQYPIAGRIPTIGHSADLAAWEYTQLRSDDVTGGSVGAVLEQSGAVAVEKYLEPNVPDSVYEVAVAKLGGLLRGGSPEADRALPIDHGFVWGVSYVGGDELLLLHDRYGITGYHQSGREVLRIADGSLPIGITSSTAGYEVSRVTPDGLILLDTFRDGRLVKTDVGNQAIAPVYSMTNGWHIVQSGIKEAAAESAERQISY